MRAKRVTLGLALCMLLDFSTPFIGGAFTFSVDECAEGLRVAWQVARPARPAATVPAPDLTLPGPRPQPRRISPPAPSGGWLGGVSRASTSRSEASPALGEDH